jgi:zinc protease
VRVPQPLVAVPPVRMVFATPDKQNAVLQATLPVALNDRDDDYPAFMLANYLLGSGGNSRLWKRIRETEGLSYDVYAYVVWNAYERHSSWNGGAIFAPGNRAKVEAAFREEIARALKDGFTAKELEEGKRGLLNYRRLSRAQDGNVAAALARNLDLGRSFAYAGQVDAKLAALTLDQVNAALRKHLDPARLVVGVAGDFKDQ